MTKPSTVFLGPSLPRAEAESLLDAKYLPPARHGDLYRELTSGTRVILLIDGVFHSTPSVWQREVLAALDEGVQVIGASSMGALRGAELHRYGMVGIGTVFEWYRDGVIEADDEVALLHAPEELGYRGMSQPLVNLRATLNAAFHAGIVNASEAATLVEVLRKLHFSKRSYAALWASATYSDLPAETREGLRRFVERSAVDVKADDARRALRKAGDALAKPGHTARQRWDRSIWDGHRVLGAGLWRSGHAVALRDVVAQAWENPELWAGELVPDADDPRSAVADELRTRFFATALDAVAGPPDPEELAPFARAFEERWQLDPTAEYLAGNGLTPRSYGEALHERALFDRLVERDGGGGALVGAWAEHFGIAFPGNTGEALVREILARGPTRFGYDWNQEVAFARELQLTGLAARIAEAMPR